MAFFFGIQLILGAVNNLISEATIHLFSGSTQTILHLSMGLNMALTVAEILILYCITTHFLKHKLDLE